MSISSVPDLRTPRHGGDHTELPELCGSSFSHLMQEPAAPPSTDQPLTHATLPRIPYHYSFTKTRYSLTAIPRHVRSPISQQRLLEITTHVCRANCAYPSQIPYSYDHEDLGVRSTSNALEDAQGKDECATSERDMDPRMRWKSNETSKSEMAVALGQTYRAGRTV